MEQQETKREEQNVIERDRDLKRKIELLLLYITSYPLKICND
jgi:hypothetical protein